MRYTVFHILGSCVILQATEYRNCRPPLNQCSKLKTHSHLIIVLEVMKIFLGGMLPEIAFFPDSPQ